MQTIIEDRELLQRHVAGDASAFREIVQRRLGFVYAIALRQAGGDTALAQDVVQNVFTALARKAPALATHQTLLGWLYRSTHYAARQLQREERRRRRREEEAHRMQDLNAPEPSPDWLRLRPELDRALDRLNETDRCAVLLRFFDDCSFHEIGTRLGLRENAARMRVDRALRKLEFVLQRHGITSTSAAIGLALSASAAPAVPAGLAVSVATGALGATTAAGVTGGLGWVAFMSSTKVQVALASVLLAGGAAGLMHQDQDQRRLQKELAALQNPARRLAAAQEESRQLATMDQALSAHAIETDRQYAQLDATVAWLRRQQTLTRPTSRPSHRTPRAGGSIFNVAELDQTPQPTSRRPPQYPAAFRKAGLEGKATVAFIVDADGQVQEAESVNSTDPAFAAAAVAAVQEWKFQPGLKDGIPVNTRLQVPIVFRVNAEKRQGDLGLNNWF